MKIKKKEGGIVVRAIFTCAEFAVRRIYNSGPKSFPYEQSRCEVESNQNNLKKITVKIQKCVCLVSISLLLEQTNPIWT